MTCVEGQQRLGALVGQGHSAMQARPAEEERWAQAGNNAIMALASDLSAVLAALRMVDLADLLVRMARQEQDPWARVADQ